MFRKNIIASKLILFSAITLILVMTSLSVSMGKPETKNQNLNLSSDEFSINNVTGTYGDFDGDDFEDDVQITFNLNLPMRKASGFQKFDIYMQLILPSGFTYYAGFMLFIRMDPPIPTFVIHGFNTVTEIGWYSVILESIMYGYANPAYTKVNHIFDPPTTGSGSPSKFSLSLY